MESLVLFEYNSLLKKKGKTTNWICLSKFNICNKQRGSLSPEEYSGLLEEYNGESIENYLFGIWRRMFLTHHVSKKMKSW